METAEERREFAERMVRVHVRGAHPDMTDDEKAEGLERRHKRLLFMLILNVFLIALYAYTFIAGITHLGEVVFWLIAVAFVLNVLLLFYQRSQLARAIAFLRGR